MKSSSTTRHIRVYLLLLFIFPAFTSDAAVILFGRTQEAINTPFTPARNPDFSGGTSPFTSTDVQNAIEEAVVIAVSNDRFPIFFQYGGNANNGRYLEIFPGIDSEEAPFFTNTPARVLTIVCSTTSGGSNADLGFFDLAVSDTVPLYTLDYAGNKRKIDIGTPATPLFTVPALGELAVRVTQGSVNKPHCYVVLSSSL